MSGMKRKPSERTYDAEPPNQNHMFSKMQSQANVMPPNIPSIQKMAEIDGRELNGSSMYSSYTDYHFRGLDRKNGMNRSLNYASAHLNNDTKRFFEEGYGHLQGDMPPYKSRSKIPTDMGPQIHQRARKIEMYSNNI